MRKTIILAAFMLAFAPLGHAQFLMDMLDTTKQEGKGLMNIYKNFDHLSIGAYIQPQFQVAQQKGAKAFEGTDFGANVSNRFMLRRSRIRITYLHSNKDHDPGVQIVFQFDANERGFTIRDIWGRVFENRFKLFSFTTGMFARPFGYELNLSSSDRENPERGRMSQILMRSERDLGAMVSFDARKEIGPLKYLKLDAGFFNGQGIRGDGDFDNKKDFIARLSVKPVGAGKKIILTGGVSLLQGGLLQDTKYVYSTNEVNGIKNVVLDSSASNEGKISPRVYKGMDVQVKIRNRAGFTELRGEYITGTQTGTAGNSETPVALMSGANGFYKRGFDGAYLYFLQHLFSLKHQLVVKYDWYDPNTKISGSDIGKAGTSFSSADIKFSTLQFGYNYYITPQVKMSLFYAFVNNEATQLNGYTSDVKDNVFTARMQFRF